MPQIMVWRRRVGDGVDDFIYGIGDFDIVYDTKDDAVEAFNQLVTETNKYPSRDPNRAFRRLREAGNPLFQRKR